MTRPTRSAPGSARDRHGPWIDVGRLEARAPCRGLDRLEVERQDGGPGVGPVAEQVLLDGGHADAARGDARGERAGPLLDLGTGPAAAVEPGEEPPGLVGRRVAQVEARSTRPGRMSAGSSRAGWLVVRNRTRPSRELTPSSALSRPLMVTPPDSSAAARFGPKAQSMSSISRIAPGGGR